MRLKIRDMAGVELKVAKAFGNAGYTYVYQLMVADAKELKKSVVLSEEMIDFVYSLSQLMRIQGLGTKYAFFLLSALQINTINSLAKYKPAQLLSLITEKNNVARILKANPNAIQVASWIDQANMLV